MTGENGKEARATRLITERASKRIGKTAFELALHRERKVVSISLIQLVQTFTQTFPGSWSPSYTNLTSSLLRMVCSERQFALFRLCRRPTEGIKT